MTGFSVHPMNIAGGALGKGIADAEQQKTASELIVRLYRICETSKARILELEAGLQEHRHTERCFRYAAARTDHGNAYCIAECSDSWKSLFVPEESQG